MSKKKCHSLCIFDPGHDGDCRVLENALVPPGLDGGKYVSSNWETKDSGEREQFDSGMVRDTQEGKPRFDLVIPDGLPYEEQMLTRIAGLMARGAEKYGDRNWEKAAGQVELDRAKASAFRHFMQWFCGETDEDHAAAVFFNIQEIEYIKCRLAREEVQQDLERIKASLY